MSGRAPSEDFVRSLTSNQRRLHAFIMSLLPDPAAAEDILQDTNVLIWRKADMFEPGTNFLAWACQIAKFQVLSHIRDQGRDRHVFDDALIEQLATRSAGQSEPMKNLSVHLAACLAECTDDQRRMLVDRYSPGASVKKMAAARSTTPNTLSIKLSRLRRVLLDCVRRKLAEENR